MTKTSRQRPVVVVVPRSEPLKRAALNGLFGPHS